MPCQTFCVSLRNVAPDLDLPYDCDCARSVAAIYNII